MDMMTFMALDGWWTFNSQYKFARGIVWIPIVDDVGGAGIRMGIRVGGICIAIDSIRQEIGAGPVTTSGILIMMMLSFS